MSQEPVITEPTNKKVDYPVINNLFEIFKSDQQLNYVLAGYFLKVFTHLTNFRNNQIMNYLFLHKKEYLYNMIQHFNRKSITDSFLKIMVSYSADIQDQEIKKELLEMILNSYNYKNEEVIIKK